MSSTGTSAAKNQTWPLAVAVFGVIALTIFALFMILGDYSEPQSTRVPATVGKGRDWAVTELNNAGFDDVRVYDSWGRDRESDDQEWKVCFQTPGPSSANVDRPVYLGSVLLGESCPTPRVGDQGWPRRLDGRMPDMVHPMSRTAFMVRTELGEKASVRFVDARTWPDEYELIDDDDEGEWWVCWQDRPAGAPFKGEPVNMLVLPYGRDCSGFLARADEALAQYE